MSKSTPFRSFEHASKKGVFSASVFLLRLAVGWMFIDAGWSKIIVPGWSASAFLAHASGPFASWFQSLAGNGLIDSLNMYGLLLIGLGVFFGCLIRPAAFFGAILMGMYYFAGFAENTAHGFVDQHVILFAVFLLFLFGGFGHVFGIDGFLSKMSWVQKHQWLKRLFA